MIANIAGRPSKMTLKEKAALFVRHKEERLTYTALAELAGVTRQTLINWKADLAAASIVPGNPVPDNVSPSDLISFDIALPQGTVRGSGSIADLIALLQSEQQLIEMSA
jgi:DNA-binding XRE family transcriptional regulator